MTGSADFNDGWREGQRAMWSWLNKHPRYDIPAEAGGCIIVLDLRELAAEFPEASTPTCRDCSDSGRLWTGPESPPEQCHCQTPSETGCDQSGACTYVEPYGWICPHDCPSAEAVEHRQGTPGQP